MNMFEPKNLNSPRSEIHLGNTKYWGPNLTQVTTHTEHKEN